MHEPSKPVERGILVFAIWATLGFLGLGIVLEGFSRDSWAISAAGVATLVTAFVAHMVANAVFRTGFTRGEAALGIGTYGLLGAVFLLGVVGGEMSMTDYYSGLTLFGVLAAGFLAYLTTRHGLRGAFSQFHIRPGSTEERP
jgi:hypothetical protein